MPSSNAVLRLAVTALALTAPSLALAHTGIGAHGFSYGFFHPIGGLDHILAMIAVGMFAVGLGGRALYAVPLAFMGFMLVGGALGMAGMPLPFVEVGIALSIVALGLIIAVKVDWPVAAAMAIVGAFAIFHGHAHGAEMPADATAVSYALGFVFATGLLHLVGIGIGLGFGRTAQAHAPRLAQVGGVVMALAGVGVLTGIV